MVQTSSHYKSLRSFTGSLSHDNMETAKELLVIEGLAISALNLVARVTLIQADQKEIAEQFPELFQGLGQITGKYQIKLQPHTTPFALTTPS